MATLFTMPKLGLDMVEGTVVRWLVNEGAEVTAGEPILEIETDKATQEVGSPASGILARILKGEGETVPCNEALAVVLAPGELMPDLGQGAPAQGIGLAVEASPDRQEPKVEKPQIPGPEVPARLFISPAAKTRAKELGVDITKVAPKGAKIGREEVDEAYRLLLANAAARPQATKQKMSPLRRRIVEHMSRSTQTAARVGLSLEVDATALIEWKQRLQAEGMQASYNVLLTKIAARALQECPYMNVQLEEDFILLMNEVNIGIAVETERGLLVPVLHDVLHKEVAILQKEYEQLTKRALEGKVRLEELQGGTFTITNLGSLEIESFLPVINVPECAILGVGAIMKKPVVLDDQVAIRQRMTMTLAFDHRLVDGAPAGRFLKLIKHLVEKAGGE